MSVPSAEALAIAYSREINDCSFNADLGLKLSSRPQSFCASVEITDTLSVRGASTFASPISVTGSVVVNGTAYMPATFTQPGAGDGDASTVGSILTANGVPIVLAAGGGPLPGESFTDITVTNTATFKNISISGTASGILDAGAY